ncbi:16S rRNA (cytosine(1402)-N(4))-methyltransferase [Candidatus Epulonipiscium fishelsonii]|uniref:16S rRNA (Cytosine(1402)-N(4))-methyltransferase n=1 Tax=Candidatus Epulonipiscium fishelsonii TaxID=77094 RepID=A0ACC8XFJ8_9FIRM|nr:16S rRNA (cytosine(1402)-N(4))-methyltransferase [Epulopiscium sp. SCG-B11WGA-EpuloA1]
MEFKHVSVLLDECIEGLNIKANGTYVDGTLGGAGHAREICKHLSKEGTFIGIDQDNNALKVSNERLLGVNPKIELIKSNFEEISNIIQSLDIDGIDGMLIDLGVSSHQLDEAERGFSYMNNATLDMRMDQDSDISAYNVVNEYSENELYSVIKKYGEENWARRIAQFIVEHRKNDPINTTYELVEIIKKAIPAKARKDGPHPAKRTFQAIRIEVNREIEIIEQTIKNAFKVLKSGGRLCIITFHSLEDRIVKHTFRDFEGKCTCPNNIPICVCNNKAVAKVISRKPILPTLVEVEQNPRSRSAKLRILEKL